MAAVRHLEFSKIAIFVMWRVSEHGSTGIYHLSRQSDKDWWRYSQQTIYFQYGGCPPFEFIFFSKSARDRSWNQNMTNMSLHTKFHRNTELNTERLSNDSRLRYSDKTIFKITVVRHLEFSKLVFWSRDLCLNVILLLHKISR